MAMEKKFGHTTMLRIQTTRNMGVICGSQTLLHNGSLSAYTGAFSSLGVVGVRGAYLEKLNELGTPSPKPPLIGGRPFSLPPFPTALRREWMAQEDTPVRNGS